MFIKLAKTLAFLLTTAVVIAGFVSIYGFHDDFHSKAVFDTFYSLPENSVDVVWIGSSAVENFFAPSEVYDETGVVGYPLATGSQPLGAVPFLIEECEKTQSPTMYLIDLRKIAESTGVYEEATRRVTGNMNLSSTRNAAIAELTSEVSRDHPETELDLPSHYFDFLIFHSRRDLTSEDFGYDPESFLGFFPHYSIEKFSKIDIVNNASVDSAPLADGQKEDLIKLLDYCDTKDRRIVFTITPSAGTETMFSQWQTAKAIVQDRGYEVIDFQENVDEMNLDYSVDFKDLGHVNISGAEKFSRYIAHILDDQYNLSDHRGDKQYATYCEVHERFLTAMDRFDQEQNQ